MHQGHFHVQKVFLFWHAESGICEKRQTRLSLRLNYYRYFAGILFLLLLELLEPLLQVITILEADAFVYFHFLVIKVQVFSIYTKQKTQYAKNNNKPWVYVCLKTSQNLRCLVCILRSLIVKLLDKLDEFGLLHVLQLLPFQSDVIFIFVLLIGQEWIQVSSQPDVWVGLHIALGHRFKLLFSAIRVLLVHDLHEDFQVIFVFHKDTLWGFLDPSK